MAKIKAKNTIPERVVRRCLRELGYRFRGNVKSIQGKPDIRIVGKKKLIFVNGCFWHGHPGCPRSVIPKANRAFWDKKINRNIERDAKLYQDLLKRGWEILVIWQCQTRNIVNLKKQLTKFIEE